MTRMTITVTAMVMLPSPSDSKMPTYSFLAEVLTKLSVLMVGFVRCIVSKAGEGVKRVRGAQLKTDDR